MLPCLNRDSLKLLVGTADERYNYSPEYFRRTHFPQVMHRYNERQLIAEITESELLSELTEVDTNGNRIYLLFGSTGSGKSELLCWLKDQWSNGDTHRPVIRISRSELNPQVLIKKCFEALHIPMSVQIDESRWDLLLKKPITLINQIIWTALAETLESDEEIVPTALLLRPIIEKNVSDFNLQVQRGRIQKPLEVLHREQLDALLASTTIPVPLDYLSFRQSLSQKLDQFLFEGQDIASLFKQITNHMKSQGVRPLLLIDDLVQSINIYATNLLDQLISLEEGNWDVVIGLTPGVVQDSDRGVELAQRIQNLDTINDRVKKLWLSDESGNDFYNLDRSQVVPYMSNYLEQLKGRQGFTCSQGCPHFMDCSGILQPNDTGALENEVKLLPFNRYMLNRTFDAIPQGKGKLRYMILHSKEIIRFFQKGKQEHISRIIPLINREKYAEQSDLLIKTFAEWYVHEDHESFVVTRMLLKHFGYSADDTSVHLQSIGIRSIKEKVLDYEVMNTIPNEDIKITIRDWVEGRKVNPELLDPIRSGVAVLVHDAVKGVNISRPFTPRTGSIVQRKDVVHRSRYPIHLDEEMQENKAINVRRGYASLQISNFQMLKYSEKSRLFQIISSDHETAKWIYDAESIRDHWIITLEQELGMKMAKFAFRLKHWVNSCLPICNSIWASDILSHSPIKSELVNVVEQFYQDWFMLRENMFEPSIIDDEQDIDFGTWLSNFKSSNVLEQYQIGEVSLSAFLTQLKEKVLIYSNLLNSCFRQSLSHRMAMVPFLFGSINNELRSFANRIQEFYDKKSMTRTDYLEYTDLDNELESHQITTQFISAEALYKNVKRISSQYYDVGQEIKVQIMDCDNEVQIVFLAMHDPQWSNLDQESERFTLLLEEVTRLRNCLSVTPRSVVKYLLQVGITSSEFSHVRMLWLRLMGCVRRLVDQKVVGSELLHLIVEWQSVDFFELKGRVSKMVRLEEEKSNLIRLLRNDLKCVETSEVRHLMDAIDSNNDLRPAIKRQIKMLLEHGHSTLPPVQWKRLLEELKEKFPQMFEAVEIRLVAIRDN